MTLIQVQAKSTKVTFQEDIKFTDWKSNSGQISQYYFSKAKNDLLILDL